MPSNDSALRPLAPNQARFVEEYLVDLNATQAAARAGYSAKTAKSQGERLLRNSRVSAAITAAKDARSERTAITADDVVRQLWALANADPNELVEVRRVCCRKCYGEEAYDARKPASTQCTECLGEGVAVVHVKDTRSLSPAARRLLAGAKQTRGGVEVKMHDQLAALAKVLDHVGRPNASKDPAEEMTAEARARAIREQLEAMDRLTIGVTVSVNAAAA